MIEYRHGQPRVMTAVSKLYELMTIDQSYQHQLMHVAQHSSWSCSCHDDRTIRSRVTTCLENLEVSGNLEHVREMSGMLFTVRELSGKCQGKNLVMEKCLKTVRY